MSDSSGLVRAALNAIVLVTIGAVLVACGEAGAEANIVLESARKLKASGDTRAAVIEYKNALQLNSELLEARWELGNLYLEVGDGASARKEFERVAELGRRDESQAIAYVTAQIYDGKFREALGFLSTIGADAQPSVVIALRGEARLGLGEVNAARAAFERALEIDADNPRGLRGMARINFADGNHQEARKLIDRAVELQPDDVQTLMLQGEFEFSQKNYARSLEAFQRARERVKDSAQVASRIIASQLGLGETEAAREALAAAFKRFPNFPPLNYLRAVDVHSSGNNVEALSAVRDVLKIQANHWQALLLGGSILFTEGENLQAESLLSRAHNARPSSLQVRKVLASALIKLGDGSRARDVLEPILDANKDDEQILGLLANAYLMLGEYPKGTELLEQAAKLSNGGSLAKTQLAISYLAEGKVDQGESTLRSVVELDPGFVKAAFVLVYALLNRQDWDGAIASAQKLADAQTDNALPLVLIGKAYAGKGDVAAAKNAYNEALKRNPDFITATFQLAQIAAVERDFATAVTLYREVLEKIPGQETAASNLARILIASKKRDEAVELLEGIRSTAPRALRARLMLAELYRAEQRWLLTLELAQEAERIAPEDTGMLLVLARAHAANGASQQAISTFERLLDRKPGFIQAQLELGQLEAAMGRPGSARDRFESVLEKEPSNPSALSVLGKLAVAQGSFEEAMSFAEKLIQEHPELPAGYAIKGDTFFRQAQFIEADAAYAAGIEQEPRAGLLIGRHRAHVRLDKRDEGRKLLVDWMSQFPDDASIQYALATWDYIDGDAERSITGYEKLLLMNPRHVMGLNNLANIEFDAGNEANGIEYARRAFEINALNPKVADTYGWILVRTGEQEKGLAILEEAARRAPLSMALQYHIAATLEQIGENQRAIQIAKLMVANRQEFPEKAQAKALLARLQ